jgi:hypothetical protein
MHRAFQKYVRPDHMGIDYTQLETFDTRAAMEDVFASQRPGGIRLLKDAIASRNREQLEEAIRNAVRIGIDRTNPEVFNQASHMLI